MPKEDKKEMSVEELLRDSFGDDFFDVEKPEDSKEHAKEEPVESKGKEPEAEVVDEEVVDEEEQGDEQPQEYKPGKNAEVDALRRQNEILMQRMREYDKLLNQQRNQEKPEEQSVESSKEEEEFEVPDFSQMDQKDLYQFIMKQLNKRVDSKVGSLEQQVQRTEQDTKVAQVQREIERTAQKYNDFWQYSPQITQIAEQYKGISPEDAYLLAKSKSTASTPKPSIPKKKVPKKTANVEKPSTASSSARQDHFDTYDDALEEAFKRLNDKL